MTTPLLYGIIYEQLGKVTQLFITQTAVKRFTAHNRKTQKMQIVTAKPVNRKVGQPQKNTALGALVRISFNKFDPKRKNRKGEREYAEKHGTKKEANHMATRLVPKKYVDPLQKIESRARVDIKDITSPFEDGGNRIVSATVLPTLQDTVAKLRLEWDAAVESYVGQWDKIVEEAKQDLNGDFALYAHVYPSSEEIRNGFNFGCTFMPMPDHNDLIEAVREEMEEVYTQRIEEAGRDLRRRLREKLEHLSARCAVAGDEGTAFRASNVTHVLELCDLLPDMMLEGGEDDDLLRAIDDARHMLHDTDADCITSSKIVANDIGAKAKEIANSLM